MDHSFGRAHRLKDKIQIGNIFSQGNSVSKFPLRLVYLPAEKEQEVPIKIAISVSKKSFKRAVDRNRIKRLLREVYRLHKQLFYQTISENYHFVLLYTGKKIPSFQELETQLIALVEKFKAQLNS